MIHSRIASLSAQFDRLLETSPLTVALVHQLDEYVQTFPSGRKIHDLSASASVFFHKQWIKISVRGHLKKIRKARRYAHRGDFFAAQQELKLARLWLGQAKKLYEVISFFTSFSSADITDYTLQATDIAQGDIILSYKTSYYLRRSPLS